MRTDVKLGIGISMALVLVVGGYFLFRSGEETPIVVSEAAPAKGPGSTQTPSIGNGKDGAGRSARTSPPRQPMTNPRSSNSVVSPAPGDVSRTAQTGPMAPATPASSRVAATGPPPGQPGSAPSASPVPTVAAPADRGSPPAAGSAEVSPVNRTEQPTGGEPASLLRADLTSSSMQQDSSVAGALGRASGSPSSAVEVHRAQPGDSLASLSQAYYGSAAHVPLLRQANPHITDPSKLPTGAAIKIPAAPVGKISVGSPSGPSVPNEQVVSSERTNSSSSPGAKRTYTVQPGDSFYRIAERQLGSPNRWRELLKLNSTLVNGDPTRLRPGQVLLLPSS